MTTTFPANVASISIAVSRETAGPFGGSRQSRFELLAGPGYDVNEPKFSVVEIQTAVPYPGVKSTFLGLLDRAGHNPRGLGTVRVTTTTSGAYTVKLKINGRVFVLKGQVDARARITRVLTVPGLGQQFLELFIDPFYPAVTGSLGDSSIFAAQKIPAGRVARLGVVGWKLTFAMLPTSAGPQGATYASGSIGAAGEVRLAGKLPDGTPFMVGTQLGIDLTLPVYARLYAGKGVLHGYHLRQETPVPAWVARATWVKPATAIGGELGAPVNESLLSVGTRFVPRRGEAPLSDGFGTSSGRGVLRIGLDGGQALELPFQIGSGTAAVFESGQELSPRLRVDRRTGLFHGSVKLDAAAPARTFRGAIVDAIGDAPLQGEGAGFLIDGSSSRAVRVVAKP